MSRIKISRSIELFRNFTSFFKALRSLLSISIKSKYLSMLLERRDNKVIQTRFPLIFILMLRRLVCLRNKRCLRTRRIREITIFASQILDLTIKPTLDTRLFDLALPRGENATSHGALIAMIVASRDANRIATRLNVLAFQAFAWACRANGRDLGFEGALQTVLIISDASFIYLLTIKSSDEVVRCVE